MLPVWLFLKNGGRRPQNEKKKYIRVLQGFKEVPDKDSRATYGKQSHKTIRVRLPRKLGRRPP